MRNSARATVGPNQDCRRRGYVAASAVAAGAILLTMAGAAKAQSVEEFYKGKNLDVYTGHSEGGAYSSYARLVARHIARHIPGNPTPVYRLKPGASGLVLARWLNAAAPKDGLSIGTFHERIGVEPLIMPEEMKFDGRDFTWLIALARNASVCFTWAASGIKSIEDAKKREVIAGASGATATDAVMPRFMNAMLGTKFKIISGYSGSDTTLALERGELEARCGFGYGSLKAVKPEWIAEKKINILAQFATKSHPELKHVPLLVDLVSSPEDKAAIVLADGTGAMARPFAAPPRIPADRAKALRAAFDALIKDPEFVADADKQRLELDPASGEEIEAMLAKLYQTPRSVAERVVSFRSPGATESRKKKE